MMFGKRLSDYIAFCGPFLLLILATGIVRLALSLGGAPNATAKWFSMSALVWIGVLYYSIRVHTTGFGSYKHLLVICTLQNLVAQAIALFGILLAIFTGTDNIFSAPEYSFGGGNPWFHAAAHALIGTTVGSLMPWLIGSVILFVTKKLSASKDTIKSVA
jgi:hypothetical protein